MLVFFFGCVEIERSKTRVEVSPAPMKKKEQSRSEEHLRLGQKLLARGDFEGSLKEHQNALSLSGKSSPGDEALFQIGLIYAHPENPKKDYEKSLDQFRRLVKDHPDSPRSDEARIWREVLQENQKLKQANDRLGQANEKLSQTNEKLNQTIENLNQLIQKSKQVDIEIEEKKREKTK
jgi:tetratricopeptide (TPR) repeat protein